MQGKFRSEIATRFLTIAHKIAQKILSPCYMCKGRWEFMRKPAYPLMVNWSWWEALLRKWCFDGNCLSFLSRLWGPQDQRQISFSKFISQLLEEYGSQVCPCVYGCFYSLDICWQICIMQESLLHAQGPDLLPLPPITPCVFFGPHHV